MIRGRVTWGCRKLQIRGVEREKGSVYARAPTDKPNALSVYGYMGKKRMVYSPRLYYLSRADRGNNVTIICEY